MAGVWGIWLKVTGEVSKTVTREEWGELHKGEVVPRGEREQLACMTEEDKAEANAEIRRARGRLRNLVNH